MRMPRFTIQRMMVIVAVVGLAIGIGVQSFALHWRSRIYEVMAESEEEEQGKRRAVGTVPNPRSTGAYIIVGKEFDPPVTPSTESNYWQNSADWHSLRAKAYRRVARYPWLGDPPDPPWPP